MLTQHQQQIRDRVRAWVLPFYERNDDAHLIDHADMVMEESIKIMSKLVAVKLPTTTQINHKFRIINAPLEFHVDHVELVIMAVYCHDMLCAASRDEHHELAYLKVLASKEKVEECLGRECTQTELELIALACYEHRSSYKGTRVSIISEIVAAGDRGEPVTSLSTYRRSYVYSRSMFKTTHEEACVHCFNHIREKFIERCPYPKLTQMYYADTIKRQLAYLSSLTLEDIQEAAKRW